MQMWNFICPELLKAIETEPETEVLCEFMHSMAKVFNCYIPTYLTMELGKYKFQRTTTEFNFSNNYSNKPNNLTNNGNDFEIVQNLL